MFLKNYFLFTVWFRRGDFTALRSMLNVFVHQIRFFGVNITISLTAPAAIGAVRLLVRNFRIHSAKNERTMFFSTLRPKKFEKLSSEKKNIEKTFFSDCRCILSITLATNSDCKSTHHPSYSDQGQYSHKFSN